jgi:HEAT repeat protein
MIRYIVGLLGFVVLMLLLRPALEGPVGKLTAQSTATEPLIAKQAAAASLPGANQLDVVALPQDQAHHPLLAEGLTRLGSADAVERASAAVLLASLGNASASHAALREALAEDPSVLVRTKVAWAMGDIADREFSPSLRAALNGDADASVRARAAWALIQIRDPAARRDLRDAARAPREDLEVRRQAIEALGVLQDQAAARALVEVVLEPDAPEYVRDLAIMELASMGDVAIEPMIDGMREMGRPLGEFATNIIEVHGEKSTHYVAGQLRVRLP